ncbi:MULTISPECIES: PAS domain S-box protein [Rhodonellum]|nr:MULTISPECIES: PAS domain S-box protein [Rhodonellum]SDZ32840.1 PAS domain S-box-containing protein [Rhodonellum ikkaensis]
MEKSPHQTVEISQKQKKPIDILKNDFHIKKQTTQSEEFIEPLSGFSLLQTQSLLFSVLNGSNSGISITDDKGVFIFVNEEFCRILGCSRSELLGKNFINCIPEAFQKQALADHQDFIKTGIEKPVFWQTTRKDGAHIDLSETVQLLVQPDGQRLKMSTITDLTEKNKAEETIFRERNLLRTLIDIIPDNIFVKDRDSRHLINNKANLELIGAKSEKDTIGKTIAEFVNAADAQKFLEDDRKVIESEIGLFNQEETILNKNGSLKTLLTTKIPLRDKSGWVIGLVGISRDISVIKKREQELKLMESVITNSTDSVIITESNLLDAPGPKIIYVNNAFTRLTGYGSEEVMGRNPRFLQGPNSDFSALGLLGVALRRKEPFEIETINYKKGGEEFWVNISVTPLKDEGGTLTHFLAIQRDITERKLSEAALIAKTKLLKGIAVVIETLMDFDDWEKAVSNCLKIMGETVDADRAYFIKNYRDPLTNRLMANQELEWTNGKVSIQIDNPHYKAIELEEHPLFLEAINHKKPFAYLTKDLDDPTKKILEEQDILSTLQVPIFIENDFYGYIGFDDCTKGRIWNADEISFLQSLTTNLAVAMERKDNLDTIKRNLQEKNTILESIGDAFFAVNKKGEVTYMNHTSRKLLKLEKEEILGANLWETYRDLKESAFYSNYHKAIKTMKPVHFDEYNPALDIWFGVSAFPSSSGLSVYFRDITEKRRKEEEIAIYNQRFEKLSKATNDAIWDWDIPSNALFWGEGFKILFGFDIINEKPTWEKWEKQLHEIDHQKVIGNLARVFGDPKEHYFENEYRLQKSDGSYAYVIDRGSIIRNSKGKPVRMIGAIQDITHRKEYEGSLQNLNTELLKSNKDLSISNQELEQFAYVASHDLQEPLRMITSFLTQIERKYGAILDEKGKKYIHFAVDGAQRMREIILELLEFSRVGRPDGAKEPIDTTLLIQEVLLYNRKLITGKKAKIVFSNLPEIYGFKNPLQLLFQNLITNAVKYQKEGQKPLITIEGKEMETHWEFSVQDNGIGINAEYFDKIFIIFQRLHQKDEYSGSGMGLAICKKIIENHNGKIWVSSVEGEGSSFHFTLGKQ